MRQDSSGEKLKHKWVALNDISPYLPQAAILAEDDRFYEHNGFDWEAIKHAIEVNWQRKEFAFGASTITQQVAKNLYLSPAKNPLRKFKEMLITVKLERDLSKERILEIYLNIVEWGPGVFGAEAAANHYFNTSAKHLSAANSAFLVSILPSPIRYGKRGYHLGRRARSILRRL